VKEKHQKVPQGAALRYSFPFGFDNRGQHLGDLFLQLLSGGF